MEPAIAAATSDPQVTVLRHRDVVGANDLEGLCLGQTNPDVTAAPFDGPTSAFQRAWGTDAYFVCYALRDTPGGPFVPTPRCNKASLAVIRGGGGDLQATMIAVDLDTRDHAPWASDVQKEAYVTQLSAACERDPVLALWWGFYFTKHGARLIYRLQEPVPVDCIEAVTRGLLDRLEAAGVTLENGTFKVDRACVDWTRLFRLPRVVRDGAFADGGWLCEDDARRLDAKLITPVLQPVSTNTLAAAPYQGELPPEQDIFSEMVKGGKLYKWGKKVRDQLNGTESAHVIWKGWTLAQPGDRNNAVHRVAGQCCTLLAPFDETTPELIYALLLPAVKKFTQDEKEPWEVTLWKAVCKWWPIEQAKLAQQVQQKAQEREEHAAQQLTAFESIAQGMKQWTTPAEQALLADPKQAPSVIVRKLIASPGHTYYVLRDDGFYDPNGVSKDMLISKMREHRLNRVIDLEWVNEKGKVQRLKSQDAIDQFSTSVDLIEGCPRRPNFRGGTIEEGGGVRKMTVPLFGIREDLWAAATHPQPYCDDYLRAWGTHNDNYEWLTDWIAASFGGPTGSFSRPMPLLSIDGPPSIGKQLIVRALAECVTTGMTATDRDFGTFSPALMHSPFLLINEGQESRQGGRESSAIVRHLTGGDPFEVNRKFKVPVTVRNPIRIVVSANNQEVILDLLGGRHDQTPEDRAALLMRVVHLKVDDAPARWLASHGGHALTSKPGARWVQGVDGEPSDFVLAKHLLWIAKTKQLKFPSKNGRFAIEGHIDGDLMQRFSTRTGSAPIVVETLIRMIESPGFLASGDIVLKGAGADAKVLVTASAIIEAHRNDPRSKKELNHKNVGSVLRSLRAKDSPHHPRPILTPKGERTQRWTEVELAMLLREAQDHGYRHEVLKGLVSGTVVDVRAS